MIKAAKILSDLKCPFIINQVSYSIFNRSIEADGLKEAAKKLGIGLITFCPLAQGLLTDKYINGIPKDSRIVTSGQFLNKDALTPERLKQISDLNDIAKTRGESLAQMALSWILKDGYVTSVLIGASKPQQIIENLKILDRKPFTADELAAIDAIAPAI